MSFLSISDVSVSFGVEEKKVEILNNINLDVAENEFVAIIGFSGSGKSTLISLLAGLQLPSYGEVALEGKPIVQPSPELGIMFQNYSLLPWLSVFENIELAVKKVFPSLTSIQRKTHIGKYIEMVNLTPAIDKKPSELSGGMRQRASLARTLSMEPKILLLDEPLSALDALTRSSIQDEILNIWEKEKQLENEEDGLMSGDRQRSWSVLGAATRPLTGQHMSGVHLQPPDPKLRQIMGLICFFPVRLA